MRVLKDLVWSGRESRLRAGCRIVIQLTVFFGLMKGLSAIAGVPDSFSERSPLSAVLVLSGVRLLRVLGSVWIAGRILDRRPFLDFGLHVDKRWMQDLLFGVLLGFVLMAGIFATELAAGWIEVPEQYFTTAGNRSFAESFAVFTVLFVCVGFSEELMYRGYHLTNMAEGVNSSNVSDNVKLLLAVIGSSALFAVFHLGSPHSSPLSTAIILLWGVLGGVSFVATGRLALAIGVHISWNLCQACVFGFPVSGEVFPRDSVTIIAIEQSGPQIWTGGAYGPEGGLIGLIFVLVGIVVVFLWAKLRRYDRLKIQPPIRT